MLKSILSHIGRPCNYSVVITSSQQSLLLAFEESLSEFCNILTTRSLQESIAAVSAAKNCILVCTETVENTTPLQVFEAAIRNNNNVYTVLLVLQNTPTAVLLAKSCSVDMLLADWDLNDNKQVLTDIAAAIRLKQHYKSPSVKSWFQVDNYELNVHLTPRERTVLRLILNGLSNAEIASELFIAQSTAKSYSRDVLRKLGVRSRHHAMLKCLEPDFLSNNASIAAS